MGCRDREKYAAYMASSNKKNKRNLLESDSENKVADILWFIVYWIFAGGLPIQILAVPH